MTSQPVNTLSVAEAATWLNIDEPTLAELLRAGFLKASPDGNVPLSEVKSFALRNAGAGSAQSFVNQNGDIDPLIQALDAEIDDLARHAEAIFSKAVPQTREWTEEQRSEFVGQARGRFSAILAVVGQGAQVDEALRRDLEDVGAQAAWAGSSLPHLQLILRISRDLLLTTAMEVSEGNRADYSASLSPFLARLLPAIDNLLDAIAQGYWEALLERHRDIQERVSALVERLPYPIYEADLDGLLRHVNIAFTRLFERPAEELIGVPIGDIVRPVEGEISELLSEPGGDVGRVKLVVDSPLGGLVRVDVDTVVRRSEGAVEGFAGMMRVRRV